MNACEFIKATLNNISSKIKEVCLKYAYDNTSDFHIVEVSPEYIRRGNQEYMNMEYDLITEFRKYYPEEELLVSEPNPSNVMTNLIFQNIELGYVQHAISESISYPNFSYYLSDWKQGNSKNKYLLAA